MPTNPIGPNAFDSNSSSYESIGTNVIRVEVTPDLWNKKIYLDAESRLWGLTRLDFYNENDEFTFRTFHQNGRYQSTTLIPENTKYFNIYHCGTECSGTSSSSKIYEMYV